MNKLRILLQIGIIAHTTAAMAADGKGPIQHVLSDLDTNDDKQISLMEFQARENNPLLAMDSDQNGVLTVDEFINARPNMGMRNAGENRAENGRWQPSEEQVAQLQEMHAQRATARFQAMDSNTDEIVTLEEFQAGIFAELDRNDDGVLTARELRQRRMGGPAQRRHRGNHFRGGNGQGAN